MILESITFPGASEPSGDLPTSGVLTSPNWPEDYSNDIHLIWKIAVPKGNIITIQMTHKELEYAEYADYVRITEGPGTGPTIKRYHGKSTGWRDQVLSTTEAVTVTFITDGSVTKKGWRLEWGECRTGMMCHCLSDERCLTDTVY